VASSCSFSQVRKPFHNSRNLEVGIERYSYGNFRRHIPLEPRNKNLCINVGESFVSASMPCVNPVHFS
jgi:hypothetical protein